MIGSGTEGFEGNRLPQHTSECLPSYRQEYYVLERMRAAVRILQAKNLTSGREGLCAVRAR
jgi:hypothetical protein